MSGSTQNVNEEKNLRENALVLNYSALNQLILKDLKNRTTKNNNLLRKYKREEVARFLDQPSKHEKQLREVSRILYNNSNHYKRAIQYFSNMLTLDYIVTPIGDFEKLDQKSVKSQYKKTLDFLEKVNIKHEFSKILSTAFREDVFYGYEHEGENSYFIQKLNPDYCQISSIEDGCYNFAFDFSYFNANQDELKMYPAEFRAKYKRYQSNANYQYQELDSKKTICIKINEDIDYIFPPLAAVFEGIFEIQDYKDLRKDKTELSNYKLLIQKLPIRTDTDHNNDFMIDYENMILFHNKASEVMPDRVALVTSPMEFKEINFDKDTIDSDNVEKATRDYWAEAGIPQTIFSSDKTSSVGIGYSIQTDEAIMFTVLRQIERWINRRLKFFINNIKFRIKMLDVTIYNKDELFDRAYQGSNMGFPFKMIASSVGFGLSPLAVVNMAILENEILDLPSKFIPTTSAHTAGTNESTASSDKGGAPKKKDKELSDEGIRAKDKK